MTNKTDHIAVSQHEFQPSASGRALRLPERSGPEEGGLPSISPPVKVIPPVSYPPDPFPRVLAWGIDSLVVSLDLFWASRGFHEQLEALKDSAASGKGSPFGSMRSASGGEEWRFEVMPHGRRGHAWLLNGNGFLMSIGDWMSPRTRPGMMIEVRSETLWTLGPKAAIGRALDLVEGESGRIARVMVSRADLCVDLLLSRDAWPHDVNCFAVTRANKSAEYISYNSTTGLCFGSGPIQLRLYDKPVEIATKSNKVWMYDVWGIPEGEIPEDAKVLRVEFQMRREAIKQLGAETLGDFWRLEDKLWAYLTRDWFKLQDNPGEHHTKRATLAWWQLVQDGYGGAQSAHPAIRAKAIRADQEKLFQQLNGLAISMAALDPIASQDVVTSRDFSRMMWRWFLSVHDSDKVLTKAIKERQVRYARAGEKFNAALLERKARSDD